MSSPEKFEFERRAIVGAEHSDGTRSTQEMIVRQSVEGELVIVAVPGTKRELPLTREEAEQWVFSIPSDMPDDVRQSQIEMLCRDQ